MIVADAARLRVTTSTGPADITRPFLTFAGAGSVVTIDHPLLRDRRLARIELDIDWAEFPPRGLAVHYRDYLLDAPFANASFTVAIAAPLAGWAVEQARKLFAANGVSRFTMVAKRRRDTPAVPLILTLATPDCGFGDAHYAASLMAASARLARGESASLPNPPYRPIAARIELRVLPA